MLKRSHTTTQSCHNPHSFLLESCEWSHNSGKVLIQQVRLRSSASNDQMTTNSKPKKDERPSTFTLNICKAKITNQCFSWWEYVLGITAQIDQYRKTPIQYFCSAPIIYYTGYGSRPWKTNQSVTLRFIQSIKSLTPQKLNSVHDCLLTLKCSSSKSPEAEFVVFSADKTAKISCSAAHFLGEFCRCLEKGVLVCPTNGLERPRFEAEGTIVDVHHNWKNVGDPILRCLSFTTLDAEHTHLHHLNCGK